MMYSRLTLARNLLSDTGVIFISIDVNEIHNLRKICEMLQGQQVENLSYLAFSGILCDMCDLTKEEQMEFLNQLEEILFCGTRVKQDVYEYVVGMCKKCKRLMVKQMSWTMRMRYYLIAMLW